MHSNTYQKISQSPNGQTKVFPTPLLCDRPSKCISYANETDSFKQGASSILSDNQNSFTQFFLSPLSSFQTTSNQYFYAENASHNSKLNQSQLKTLENRFLQTVTQCPNYAHCSPSSKVIVLDMDETLIHTEIVPYPSVLTKIIKIDDLNLYVSLRPYLFEFLRFCRKNFMEVICWTASEKEYADKVLDQIDPMKILFTHRLYNTSCSTGLKCLATLGYLPENIILIDDNIHHYLINACVSEPLFYSNQMVVTPFLGSYEDAELLYVMAFLLVLREKSDVRFDLWSHACHMQNIFEQRLNVSFEYVRKQHFEKCTASNSLFDLKRQLPDVVNMLEIYLYTRRFNIPLTKAFLFHEKMNIMKCIFTDISCSQLSPKVSSSNLPQDTQSSENPYNVKTCNLDLTSAASDFPFFEKSIVYC